MVKSIHGFAEKVALIINGSAGVGRATALQLALQGAFVIIGFDEETEVNRAITEQLKSLGTLAHAVRFDSAGRLIDEVEKIYGRVDLIVICVKKSDDSELLIRDAVTESQRLTETRPKVSIVVCGEDDKIIETTKQLSREMPKKYRMNCVITKSQILKKEFQLFTENNFDDTARVITFLLSSEAKALNGQVLYID